MSISKDEIKEWLQHPVTVDFRNQLRAMHKAIKDDWAAGLFTSESSEGTAQKNAVALGCIRQLEDILNLATEEVDEQPTE